MDIMLVA